MRGPNNPEFPNIRGHSRSAWTTTDELKHIKMIGHHRDRKKEVSLNEKYELLRGYLNGCELRTDWRGMDRTVVLAYARKQLAMYVGLTTPRKVD